MKITGRTSVKPSGDQRRMTMACPQCGAERYERCREWVTERCSMNGVVVVGEGRWAYLKNLHEARRPSRGNR